LTALAAREGLPYLSYMKPAYDIDLVSAEVLDWLTRNFPRVSTTDKTKAWKTKGLKPQIRWRPMSPNYYGYVTSEQRGTTIYLNQTLSYTLEELVKTICHEYCHTLQDQRLYHWYSSRLKTGYNKHPMELEAVLFEEDLWADVFSTRYSRREASDYQGSEDPDLPIG
jgi:hypothetical protein